MRSRRAGDAARLAHPRRGHHVGLDRRLQPVDLEVLLQPAHDLVQAALVDDGGHLLVVAEPPGDVAVEPVLRSLADADDGGPDVVEGARELLLVVREARLDQHHVHDGLDDTERWAGYRPPMANVVFVAPYALDATTRFVGAVCAVPGARVGLVSSDPVESFPEPVRAAIAGHWRIDDCLDADQLTGAVAALGERLGSVDRLVAILENLLVPLAQVRERLGIDGVPAGVADNFRDKARMKAVFEAAGVPCARSRRVESAGEVHAFAAAIGFPFVAKPLAGAGARNTFRIDDDGQLAAWLASAPPVEGQPMLLEEFVRGDEHSFDSVLVDGRLVWHSISRYLPSPLDVLEHPWIQWCVLLPRDIDGFDEIVGIGAARRHRARPAHGPVAHGVVPPGRRLRCRVRGRGPAAGRPVHDPDVVRPRRRHVRGLGPPRRARRLRPAAPALCRRRGVPAGPGTGPLDRRRPRSRRRQRGDPVPGRRGPPAAPRRRAERDLRGRRPRHRARPRHGRRRGGPRRAHRRTIRLECG